MYKIAEYLVFYLKLETIGSEDDLVSIGVRERSIAIEKSHSKILVDALATLMKESDAGLHSFEGYREGVGEDGIKMQHFGPVFIAYVKNYNKESVKALYSLMAIRLPLILRKSGTKGRFYRGAFVKGLGWEISEGGCTTLYGPVMAKAWYTLTTKAYSCRIIIEQSIFKIVGSRDSYGPGEDGDWLPLYARRDYDGQAIFDYLAFDPILGKDATKAKGIVKDMKQTLAVIDQFATKMAAVYYSHDNSTSVRMAVSLFDYVIESISSWTGQEAIEIIRELPGRDKVYRNIMAAINKEG